MAVPLTELVNELDGVLEPHKFKDYCPNGLQVQGREEVSLVVSGVTACQALIDAAVEEGADAILVHHGYFWRDEDACITGMKKRRLKALLDNNISLLAYHLPLDAHPEYGNNVSLARMLGIEIDGKLDPQDPVSVGNTGHLPQALPIEDFLSRIEQTLGRRPQHIGLAGAKIQSLGWCTGAAQGYIEQALTAGVDAYLTGEISEQTVHVAREEGIHFIAAGHHATERYGVQALGEYLSKKFSLQHRFIDIDNPV